MAGWEDGCPGRLVRVKESSPEESGGAWRFGTDGVTGELGLSVGLDGAGLTEKVKIRKWQSCKPWRGSRCVVYHEHKETERCGDVFMGR
jgi:hypothetical protein